MNRARWLTRQDVALMIDLSVDVVRRNEKRLGLSDIRVDLNKRSIRYRGAEARAALRARGLLLDPGAPK